MAVDLEPDFLGMHEIRRHSIHTVETLEVTLKVLVTTQEHCRKFTINLAQGVDGDSQNLEVEGVFASQITLLRSLLSRAQSNKERLSDETTLAYNTMTQKETTVMNRIGEATKNDSAAMKSIAFVTMTFLPATFLSVSNAILGKF